MRIYKENYSGRYVSELSVAAAARSMVEDCYDPYKKPESVTHDQIEQLTELVAFLYQKLDEKHVLNRYDIKEIFTMGFRIEDE